MNQQYNKPILIHVINKEGKIEYFSTEINTENILKMKALIDLNQDKIRNKLKEFLNQGIIKSISIPKSKYSSLYRQEIRDLKDARKKNNEILKDWIKVNGFLPELPKPIKIQTMDDGDQYVRFPKDSIPYEYAYAHILPGSIILTSGTSTKDIIQQYKNEVDNPNSSNY